MSYFYNYTFSETVCIFLIYSFVGWCTEVVYATLIHGRFVNRGFMIGPVCPIYGFGVLSVVMFLEPVKENWALLFLASMVFTSLIELAAGFVLERLFNEKWWDYSEEPFNLKGYICLKFSIMWGLACVLVIDVVHPTIMKAVRLIPHTVLSMLLLVLFSVFIADAAVTMLNVLKIRIYIRSAEEIKTALEQLSETIGGNLSEKTLDAMEHGEKLKESFSEREQEMKDNLSERKAEYEELKNKLKAHYEETQRISRRIVKAFPNIEKGRYRNIFKK